MKNQIENSGRSVSLKREKTGGHFVDDRAKGKKVAAWIERLAKRLFRRHVGDGAHGAARAGDLVGGQCATLCDAGCGLAGGSSLRSFGEAEIKNFGIAARGNKN